MRKTFATEMSEENKESNNSEETTAAVNSSENVTTEEVTATEQTTQAVTEEKKTESVEQKTTEKEETKDVESAPVVLSVKDYHTDFKVSNKWENQFEAEITITNDSDKTIEDWNFTFTFPYEIDKIWNAFVSAHKDDKYQIENGEWNADIKPGASVAFQLIANYDNTEIIEPKDFELSSEKVKLEADSYNAEFCLTSDWESGYTGTLTITNNTDKVIKDWVLAFDFDYSIDNIWDADIVEHTDNHYLIKNKGYNAELTKGESIELALQGKPGKVANGPYNYELYSYEDLKLELEAPTLILDGSGEYPVLSWNRIDGATSYTVKRKHKQSDEYQVLATNLTENTYTDMEAGTKGECYYVVTADNKFTSSPDSNEECYCSIAKTPALCGQVDDDEIELIWTESIGARSYTLYRSTKSGGPYYVLGDKLLKTEFTDKDANEDEVYYYVVVAENERGVSEYSNEIKLGLNEEREYTFDGDADDDQDGLINSDELLAGTDLFSKDTDNDALNDAEEVALGTNPMEPDTDGDGIYDGAEVILKMDPLTPNEMGEYETALTSDSGRAKVHVLGDSNFVIAPFAVNDSENVLVNSLTGIVGNAVDFTTGGFDFKNADVTFTYTDEELEKLGYLETDLTVFHLNYDTKQLETIGALVADTEANTLTLSTEVSGTYLLGYSKMAIDLSNVDIVFAIDQSGSMSSNDPQHYRILAAQRFLEQMKEDSYRAGILAFEDTATVKADLTNDTKKLNKVLESMKTFGGGTNLYNAIMGSVKMFKDNNRRKIVILLTDGYGGNPVPKATDECNKNNVVVNTIALGSSTDADVLKNIASYTKGGYFFINNSRSMTKEDVEKQINLIYEKLSKQLTLSEKAEDEDLPEGKTTLEFSDLYNGIDSFEAQEWMTTASTNLMTGNYIYDVTDMDMQGNGYNLSFSRTYNSLSASEDSILGKGYHTNFETKVEKKDESSGANIQTGIVDASRLNVRAGAGTSNKIIGALSKGAKITVLKIDEVDGRPWYKINYKGKDGYVAGWYINGSAGYEVTFPTGTKIFFTENKDGSILENKSTDADFIKKKDGGYRVINADLSKYDYDKDGKLEALYDRNGNKLSVSYKDKKISKVEDEVGRYLKFTYGDNGLLSSVSDMSDRKVSYEYDKKKHLTKVTDVDGNATKYVFHEKTGILTTVTDPEGHQIVRNDYDALGRIVRQYDGEDIIQYFIYDDEIDKKSEGTAARYMINGNGKESKTTFSADLKPVIERDAYGQKTKYKYEYYNDDTDEWIDITTKRDGDKTWETYEEYSRNNRFKRRETVTDKNGNKTITKYNKKGNPTEVTDANGVSATMKYDSFGNLIEETDKAGNITKYEYDDDGVLLLSKTGPLTLSTKYTYYTKGKDGIKLKGLVKTETDQRGSVTTYHYDDTYNNCIKVEAPCNTVTETTYSKLGRKKTEKDGNGNITEYAYDKSGRVKTITDALGKTVSYTYDKAGNKTSETDKKGNTTKYSYDAKNQLIKTTDALGNETEYTYDHIGNVLTEKNAKGETSYTYDSLGRKTQVKNALGQKTKYAYDYNGNLYSETDALGRVVTYTYNKLNQMASKTEPLGRVTKYSYDKLGNLKRETDINGDYTETTYDALGRVVQVRDKKGNNSYVTYDDVNGIVTKKDANGAETITTLDALSREIKVEDAEHQITEYTYDGAGNLKTEKDPLERVTEYSYDKLNRKISVNVKYKENGEVKDCKTVYEYDDNGNVTKETKPLEQITAYEYDALNRVKKEINAEGGETFYTYDEVGNVTEVLDSMNRTTRKVYDALSRPVEEYDAKNNKTSYTYDAAGNLTKKVNAAGQETNYTYNELNQNTVITDDSGNSEVMEYDVFGNNTARQDRNGNVTKYEYDKNSQLIGTKDPYQNTIRYEYDAVGNQIKITDAKNQVTETSYDAVGRKKQKLIRKRILLLMSMMRQVT